MNAYVSDFISRTIPVPTLKETALRAAVSTNRSAVTVAINKYVNKLSTDMPYTDQFISSFINVMEYIPLSDSITVNNYDSDADTGMIQALPSDQAEELFDELLLAAPKRVLEVSDADGFTYQLIFSNDAKGRKVIKTTANPVDFRDYLLYYDDERASYVLNGVIKSIGFFRPGDAFAEPQTVRDALLVIADYLESPYDIRSVHDFLINLVALPAETTIVDAAHLAAERFGATFTGEVFTTLLSICHVLRDKQGTAPYGVKRPFSRIIHDVTVNSTINDMLIKVGTLVCEGLNDIAILTAQVREYIDSKVRAVSQLANDLQNAFILGGWYGLAMYLIDIINGVKSIQSADGKLTFTDNDSQVPQQYIAGIIFSAVGAVTAAAGAILTALNPVVGVIVGLVGSVVGAIPLAFSYDYERNTTAAVSTNDELVLPYSPLAFLQDQFTATGVWTEILRMCQEQLCLCYFDVPGGCILCGASDSPDQIRVEFHPSCVINTPGTVIPTEVLQNLGSFRRYVAFQRKSITRERLEEYWRSVLESPKYVANAEGGVLSPLDDKELRAATMAHIGLFAAWLLNVGALDAGVDDPEQWIAVPSTDWDGKSTSEPWPAFGGITWGHCLSMFFYGQSGAPCSWEDIASAAVSMCSDRTFTYNIYEANLSNHTTGAEVTLPDVVGWSSYYLPGNDFSHMVSSPQAVNFFDYYFVLPKYDRKTFLNWVFLSAAIAAVATVATVVASVKVSRWRAAKRAKLTSTVANSWETYQKSMQDYDPTDEYDRPEYHTSVARTEAYNAYYKSVRVNNRWAGILGGTRYSLAGYWDSDPSPSPNDLKTFDASSMLVYTPTDDGTSVTTKPADSKDYGSNYTVLKLIRGY